MDLLRDMALFVEVAKSRNFSRAATVLGMPNSSLSRRISELEKTIGLRLLNRTTRRTELTDAGQIYFERCQLIVEEALAAHEKLREMVEQPSGHLRVSMPVDFAVIYLAPLIAEFARSYPGISFDLDLSSRRADIMTEPFDLAIRIGSLPDSSLYARRIASVSVSLFASPDYLRAAGQPSSPADLIGHSCIRLGVWPGETIWSLSNGVEKVDVQARGRFAMNNVNMIQRLALLGMGIAMLGEGVTAADVAAGRLQQVLPGWAPPEIPVYAVTASRLIPAKARLFIEFLAQRLQTRS